MPIPFTNILSPTDDVMSYIVHISQYDTHGLCSKIDLRRHSFETNADTGCREAISDEIKYVGPVKRFLE